MLSLPALIINLVKVNPDTRQKGISTINVYIIEVNKDGVSPALNSTLERNNIRTIDIIGLKAKTRFILRISFSVDLLAIEAPIADPISHDPRNDPEISS